jgi:hypothetical protein
MRYCDKNFPEYAHRPGETIHPNQEGGHSFEKTEPKAIALDVSNFADHPEYLFGFDLYNHGYFWEAHVYWEACWHAVGRKGDVADLLKSLILLSAGRLKYVLNQREPAIVHWKRSYELVSNLAQHHLLGLDLNSLLENLQEMEKKTEEGETLQHILKLDR